LKIFDFSKFPKTVFLVKCYENLINSLNLGLVRRFVEKLTNYYFVLNLGYSDDRSRTWIKVRKWAPNLSSQDFSSKETIHLIFSVGKVWFESQGMRVWIIRIS